MQSVIYRYNNFVFYKIKLHECLSKCGEMHFKREVNEK